MTRAIVEDVAETVLEITGISQHFAGPRGTTIRAVNDVSLSVRRGETLGIVGESGSGKTTVGRTSLRLYRPTAGQVVFEGEDVTHASTRALRRHLRRRSAMVFQNPTTSLNPQLRLGETLAEPLEIHRIGSAAQRRHHVADILERVGIAPDWAMRFPRELSGGQRQRIGVARALMLEPSLIVADEPTAALDVSVQAQVVNLLADLQAERSLSYVFISHDLSLVRHISHRVAVMYLGRVIELGTAEQIFQDPRHPYTVSLASMQLKDEHKLVPQGEIPSPIRPPSGCVFHPRCPIATAKCAADTPFLEVEAEGRTIACHYPGKVVLPAAIPVRSDLRHPVTAMDRM
ncbi:ABC transporter ATP-binding protein [Microbacterium sp. A82]|uniref:ABC transporter ATP-binding protein n=1 Tax=Microbacterium sp. A82 TaxID=3450452 RepID=UPI003F388BD0